MKITRELSAQILALSLNVWREFFRDTLLQVLTASGIVFMMFSLILSKMAIGSPERVIQNVGFWVLGIWGLISVIFLGSNIIRQEIRCKTVYLILSRPVNRVTFLSGKFSGMLIVLIAVFSMLAISWLIILNLMSISITPQHFWALIFIFGEWVLLASFSLFFSTFTTPVLHNFFLAGITFLGHWANDLYLFAKNTEEIWLKILLKTVYYVLPNLEAFNFRAAAVYNEALPHTLLLEAAFVLLCWILTIQIAANLIFSNRKLL